MFRHVQLWLQFGVNSELHTCTHQFVLDPRSQEKVEVDLFVSDFFVENRVEEEENYLQAWTVSSENVDLR